MTEVSVIVTTKNEEVNIKACLESIRRQDYPAEKIEVIVIDNNSTDRTKELSLEYTNNVFNYGPERSAQRNFGVKKASGRYVLYLDADMQLSEEVLSECFNKCEKEGLIGLYIPEKIIGKGFWIKVRNFERSFYDATCIDAVRFVRKDKFLGIGGFDESLTGPEDWDFDRRIRQAGGVSIIKSQIYHNEDGFNLKEYILKKCYYSQWFNLYKQKWGESDPVIKKQLGIWYRYVGVFTENGKWLKLVRHGVLTLGMFSLRIRIGVMYLRGSYNRN
ncbi:MAG: glycosyltransferase [Candidatus Omnitrophica bacterium]|nr:glycosyltransferase [Candidatus Omnitrophota bacterium]